MEKSKHSIEELKQQFEENDENFTKFYKIVSIIGHGAFGIVLSCLDRSANSLCAVKIVNKKTFNNNDLNKLRYEAETLSILSHPNIVKYKDRLETETKIFMIMELIHGGSLRKFMDERKNEKAPITDLESSIIMKSILNAVAYMHTNNIVHRDLKPENILIDDISDLSTIKLTDFGLSVQFGREFMTRQLTQSCGTLIFMAPELAFHHPYSMTVDIWSCGVIMYMLLCNNEHPLYRSEDSHSEYLEKLAHPVWEFPPNFSKYAKDLFLRLIKQEPSERYRAEEALNHPWITRKKNMIPQTISEKRQTFYSQMSFLNVIITACLTLTLILKKLNELPKISNAYSNLVEKIQEIQESRRFHQRSLSEISPHSPHDNNCIQEETKDLTFNLNKVEESDSCLQKTLKHEGFSEISNKKLDNSNMHKNSHVKHDSIGGNTKKFISPVKSNLNLKIEKDKTSYDMRNQCSKSFYSPQKKIEISPKKLSTSTKEKILLTPQKKSTDKNEFNKTYGLSPKKK